MNKTIRDCFSSNSSHKLPSANAEKARRKHKEQNIEDPSTIFFSRNAFVRDRDRIVHSRAFRRMRGKTQVFLSSLNDHVRTRLTHTLEVALIAKTLARALGLNVDLVEAAAYGHDIGHTPFGHEGERTLHDIASGKLLVPIGTYGIDKQLKLGGFKHNLQSLRLAHIDSHQTANLVDTDNADDVGLNLTYETLWTLVVHTSLTYDGGESLKFYDEYKHSLSKTFTFEAFALAAADTIAQEHHDLVDGFTVGLISDEDASNVVKELLSNISEEGVSNFNMQLKAAMVHANSTGHRGRVAAVLSKYVVDSLVKSAACAILHLYINTDCKEECDPEKMDDSYKIYNKYSGYINDYLEDLKGYSTLRELTSDNVVNSEPARRMDAKGRFVIRKLFDAYFRSPKLLPTNTLAKVYRVFRGKHEDLDSNKAAKNALSTLVDAFDKIYSQNNRSTDCTNKYVMDYGRIVIDHISGMTDNYAQAEHARLYNATEDIY